jgi:hypothetical protein
VQFRAKNILGLEGLTCQLFEFHAENILGT